MVKKKSTHQSEDTQRQNPVEETQNSAKDSTFAKTSTEPLSRQSSIEDPSEKLQNLKSLNSLLVNEASESRLKIESLVQAKEALECELKQLEDAESEKIAVLEFRNGLLWVYFETQVREMGFEMDNKIGALKSKVDGLVGSIENERKRLTLVCKERDSARNNFELQFNEVRIMKDKLMEMEKNERKLVEEVGKLKGEYKRLVGERDKLEKMKSLVVKEKDVFEKNFQDTVKEVENLRRQIEEDEREKKEVEIEKKEQTLKIYEMEKDIKKKDEVILSLGNEERIFKSKIFELEKNFGEAMDREAERAIEVGALVEEMRAKEKSIVKLTEEKGLGLISRKLEVTMAESEDRQRRIVKLLEENGEARRLLEISEKELKDMQKKTEELLREKIEMEKVKVSGESENVVLNKEVGELRSDVHRFQETCLVHEKINKELVLEVSHLRDSFDQVKLEREIAMNELDEEKQNGVNFRLKVSEMEKEIEKTVEELGQKTAEWQNLIKEKKDMENRFGSLAEDKDRLENELSEAKRSCNGLRAKVESTSTNYDRAFTLLKNTASLLCHSRIENGCGKVNEEESSIAEQNLEDEIEPYAAELEAIKQAFVNKETVAQDLKQKVDLMEKSVVEAQKKQNFWTFFTSATSLLAAISIAYAARGR